MLIKLLEPLGFELKEAVNGEEGIKLWSIWKPHLILMDMRMPVMNGYEAVKKIKKELRGPTSTIIALTASALEQERNLILSVGCDDYLCKPFREQELFTKIEQHLGLSLFAQNIENSQSSSKNSLSAAKLQSEDLKIMSIEWIRQLHQAATQVDAELILDLLEEIPPNHRHLKENITALIEQFRFDLIINLSKI